MSNNKNEEAMRMLAKVMRQLAVVLEELADERAEDKDQLLTIEEFCERYRMSVALYYKMRSEGRPLPEHLVLGSKKLIPLTAARAWARENRQGE